MMKRNQFQHDGLPFFYHDAEEDGEGKALIALHAPWMKGMPFLSPAKELSPEWRVIALDNAGMGIRIMQRLTNEKTIWRH